MVVSLLPAREAELRRLRKANVEFEEQNAVLQKHISDMYSAKERLEAELGQDELRTQALHRHLLAIKHTLVSSLSTVALPGQNHVTGPSHPSRTLIAQSPCMIWLLLLMLTFPYLESSL